MSETNGLPTGKKRTSVGSAAANQQCYIIRIDPPVGTGQYGGEKCYWIGIDEGTAIGPDMNRAGVIRGLSAATRRAELVAVDHHPAPVYLIGCVVTATGKPRRVNLPTFPGQFDPANIRPTLPTLFDTRTGDDPHEPQTPPETAVTETDTVSG